MNLASMRAAAAQIIVIAASLFASGSALAQITIDSGALLGSEKDGVRAYLGIPFAAQPVGALRWKAPQPMPRWTQPLAATEFGPACPQPEDRIYGLTPKRQDEACLHLNVWTPASAAKPLPVMIWLHGGANRMGASSIPFYSGQHLAKRDVVVVSANYRLGYLGFFAHEALKSEGGGANFALQDQIAALQWVRKNIAAFGGDPKRITVFGESAGGADILYLMTSPAAKGLFQQAIVQSGGGWNQPPPRANFGKRIAKRLESIGVDENADAAALRKLTPKQLVEAQSGDKNLGFGPFIDGLTTTEAPAQAFSEGRAAKIPLIIGSNDWEASLMAARSLGFAGKAFSRLPPFSGWYDDRDTTAAQREALMFRDIIFAAPARWIAAAQSKHAPAWLYRFDYVTSGLREKVPGAGHGAEIAYVFDTVGTTTKSAATSGPEDRAMAAAMTECWAGFAHTGKPGCSLAKWDAYDPARDEALVIRTRATQEPHPERKALDGAVKWFGPGTVLGGG